MEACSNPFGHSDAWMMTQLGRATRGGVTGKSTLVRPAGTTTSRGATTPPFMLPLTRICIPPAGAGAVSVTVPVPAFPPTRVDVLSVIVDTAGSAAGLPAGSTTSHTPGALKFSKAVPKSSTTRVGTETGEVVTVNVALVAPSGTKTDGGTCATFVWLLISETSTPPGGAAAEQRHRSGDGSASDHPFLLELPVPENRNGADRALLPLEAEGRTDRADRGSRHGSHRDRRNDRVGLARGNDDARGNLQPGKSLARCTVMPPAGAGMLRAIRAAVGLPP